MKKILFIEAVQYGTYYDNRYEDTRKLGYEVFVLYGTGELGQRDPRYHEICGSRDIADLIKAAKGWHAKKKFDGITTLAEPSVLATAHIAEALRLPYSKPATAMASRNKFVMRQAHKKGGVTIPHFMGISDVSDLAAWPKTMFPAIVKPAMGSASTFIFKAQDAKELQHYAGVVLANASSMSIASLEATGTDISGPPVIVEDFLPGSEHLVEGYVFNGKFVLGSVVDRITIDGSTFEKEVGRNTFDDDMFHGPSLLGPDKISKIIDLVQRAVSSQGVQASAIHAEVRFKGDVPNILEVAIRPGGGGLHTMLAISYGYDPLKMLAEIAVNADPGWKYPGPGATHTVATCLMGDEGRISAIEGVKEISASKDVFFFKLVASVGSTLLRPPKGNSIVGFLGVTGKTYDEALKNLVFESSRFKVKVKELEHAE
ncbi:MAG TPA: ATP-grasp domain-containing protein [Dongiaceae bacterium]|jgi:biotin carboxylase|nr:ATP-grasp domain-containing protein [Dongiaceae bacterium]